MELQITLEEFKLIKQFHPAFSRKEGIKSNDFIIGWSELMPVVEKIESIYKQGKLFQCPQYQRIRGVKITDVTITELHALIVDFIKWYNSQNF